jgi:hypothetical protein
MESAAFPEESSVPVPMLVAPSRKETVPVGVPAGEMTAALNVTACPNTDGFWEDKRVVVVAAGVTVNVAALDGAVPAKFVNAAR